MSCLLERGIDLEMFGYLYFCFLHVLKNALIPPMVKIK